MDSTLNVPDEPHHAADDRAATEVEAPAPPSNQIVLVFQGGGALGAYQAGVYQALHEAGIEPDWIIGTSIGAINASLIAGNEPENRLERLEEFWRRMTRKELWGLEFQASSSPIHSHSWARTIHWEGTKPATIRPRRSKRR